MDYFEALHTLGDRCIVQDIDEYIGTFHSDTIMDENGKRDEWPEQA